MVPARRYTPLARPDLLVSHHLNYPDGVNLMWNTSLPLPGLLLAPVTATWGPVLSFNLLVLAYGLSAWCAYLAIRRFVPGHLAAAVGGLVYGFSPAIRVPVAPPAHVAGFPGPADAAGPATRSWSASRALALVGTSLGLMAGAALIGEELLALTACSPSPCSCWWC